MKRITAHQTLLAMLSVVAISVGGCVHSPPANPGSPPGDPEDEPPDPPGVDPEIPGPAIVANGTYAREAIWSGCHGFMAAFTWIGENPEFEGPAEWNTSSGALTGIDIFGLECDRLAWGPFERPVRMLLDIVGLDGVPDSCWLHNATVSFDQLWSLWVDDAEVAAWLVETYGLPAHYAKIETTWEPVGTTSQYAWVMTHNGATSWFRTLDSNDPKPYSALYRLFWFPGDGLGYMDWAQKDKEDSQVTSAHAEPPISIAQWPIDQLEFGSVLQDFQATGKITMFQDALCTEELS